MAWTLGPRRLGSSALDMFLDKTLPTAQVSKWVSENLMLGVML